MKKYGVLSVLVLSFSLVCLVLAGLARSAEKDSDLDARVQAFLSKMSGRWWDMNVPEEDGEALYNIILENKYTKALEIGTSTGRSGIHIAWALTKTGGKLITIEIDEGRYGEAVANFKEAGLGDYVDARLADAHELVEELPGPFDFVFIDADKEWYENYARALIPKLEPGGCIAAHNVSGRSWGRRGYGGGTGGYFEYMKSLPGFESSILPQGSRSLSVSYKKKSL